MPHIKLSVGGENGWTTYIIDASQEAIDNCYLLPTRASRALYWADQSGLYIPDGPAVIWEVMNETGT